MLSRIIVRSGIIFGLLASPTLLKKPTPNIWILLYFTNCIINYLFDKALIKTNKVSYPVRLFPNVTKINIVYDFFVCPFLSIWYCQATYNSKLLDMLKKLIAFGLPQGIYEVLLERKTDTLRFKGDWKGFYSLSLVIVVKLLSRGILALIKRVYMKPVATND